MCRKLHFRPTHDGIGAKENPKISLGPPSLHRKGHDFNVVDKTILLYDEIHHNYNLNM